MADNLLLILTDQERDTGPWDPDGLRRFRASLPHRRRLRAASCRYAEHRIATTACVPSRTSLLTGYGPQVHGVTQTDGMAKQAGDPELTWLAPDRLPTLGHRVQAAGGEAVYVGKWHLSHPKDGNLQPWGFSGWQGPEPHGPDPAHSGVARDPGFVQQACAWLRARAHASQRPPFLLVVSFVNPHDIVFWPAWSLWAPGWLDLAGIPSMGAGPTDHHRLDPEPSILAAYRTAYLRAYAPAAITRALYTLTPDRYRRFYASLLRRTDRHLGSLLGTLDETGLSASTDVVFTSDHGELLGAHGGLHQKFYNAFEETLRVPFWLRRADGRGAGTVCERPTTHLDLVPTVLSRMGIAHTTVPPALANAPTLPGCDVEAAPTERASHFVTTDHILGGESPDALVGRAVPPLGAVLPLRYTPPSTGNRAVEALVHHCAGPDGARTRWKVVRYFDPTHPVPADDDEWSLFHLAVDPCEQTDRSTDPVCAPVLARMKRHLAAQRAHP